MKIGFFSTKFFVKISALILLICGVYSCKKDNQVVSETSTEKTYSVSGKVQKGPYLIGSSITIMELFKFQQTGRNFNAQIQSNSGVFEINNILLVSQDVLLKSEGYYFNEVLNSTSNSTLTLYALANLNDTGSINVNILTALELNRVQYLISKGESFKQAKTQAQKEVLRIFSIKTPINDNSEKLNIAINSDENAMLLAISVIMQGYRTTANLSQLLSQISLDIQTDGILNNDSLGVELITDAKLINGANVRSNITSYYSSLGVSAVIPNFEKYIKQFIDSTKFTSDNTLTYPDTTGYGQNILNFSDSIFRFDKGYSMSVNSKLGTSLKIVLSISGSSSGYWLYDETGLYPFNWSISPSSVTTQQFIMTNPGSNSNLSISFTGSSVPMKVAIQYFENGATTPTRTRIISIS